MSHPDEGVLQELLDGELVGEPLETLEAHLTRCEACRARVDAMRATMLEADGLVERLVLPAPERRGAGRRIGPPQPRPGRFPLSMGQMGIAAGLLVAATAGLVLTDARTAGRRDGEAAYLQRPMTGADDSGRPATPEERGRAERISGDTFRLRAGGGAVPEAEKAEVAATPGRAKDADMAKAAAAPSDAMMRQAREAEAPLATVTETRTGQAAPPPAPSVAGHEVTTPQAAPVVASNAAPASVAAPAKLGAYAKARGERKQLASLTPVRVDSGPGLARSVYMVGATQVMLEERQTKAADDSGRGQRPTTAAKRDEGSAGARRDAPAALVPSAEYRWTVDGVDLVLRGALTRDSLMKLSQLVR